jgi:uncharacterized protein (DUF1330 family)
MAAYIIADVEVTDPETYAEYRKVVPPTLEQYGGRFVVRGGAPETLEGDWQPGRVVVLEFDDVAAAKRWYDSPEYSEIKAIRQRASRGTLIVVEGA